ncbi:MAG: NfeD family protein [Alicyclobacillus sp.]|nr:NfeD family protein [Alicyclobacillus sp.]
MAWWVWWALALALGALELATVTFVLLWIAVAAGLTGLLALAVHNLAGQLVLFVAASVGLFALTRRWSQRWRMRRTYPDRLQALVGERAVVVTGTAEGHLATVRVQGELWSAVADEPLHAGQEVVVERADSTVLTVRAIRGG